MQKNKDIIILWFSCNQNTLTHRNIYGFGASLGPVKVIPDSRARVSGSLNWTASVALRGETGDKTSPWQGQCHSPYWYRSFKKEDHFYSRSFLNFVHSFVINIVILVNIVRKNKPLWKEPAFLCWLEVMPGLPGTRSISRGQCLHQVHHHRCVCRQPPRSRSQLGG